MHSIPSFLHFFFLYFHFCLPFICFLLLFPSLFLSFNFLSSYFYSVISPNFLPLFIMSFPCHLFGFFIPFFLPSFLPSFIPSNLIFPCSVIVFPSTLPSISFSTFLSYLPFFPVLSSFLSSLLPSFIRLFFFPLSLIFAYL